MPVKSIEAQVKSVEVKGLDDLIGVARAARLANCSEQRIRYLVDSGRLPSVRDPLNRRLIDRAAVLKFARARKRYRRGLADVAQP